MVWYFIYGLKIFTKLSAKESLSHTKYFFVKCAVSGEFYSPVILPMKSSMSKNNVQN